MSRKLQMAMIMLMAGIMAMGCGNTKSTTKEQTQSVQTSEENSTAAEDTEEAEETAESDQEESQVQDVNIQEKDENTQNANGTALPKPAISAEELVKTGYNESDPYYDFKVEYTKDYLDKINVMYGFLSEDYVPSVDDDSKIYVQDNRGQCEYRRKVQDFDKKYQYIYEIVNYLGFEDDSKDLYAWQKLVLNLCDEDKDGKIELNDESSTILKTFYPDIDLTEVQSKIDEAVEAEKTQDYKTIRIEKKDKNHGAISFSWFRYEDNPVQVEITLDTYKDYPQK